MTAEKYPGFPILASVPLLWLAFGCGLFFQGTDTIWFVPSLLSLLLGGIILLAPGWRNGWALPRAYVCFFVAAYWAWLPVALFWSTVPFISILFTVIFSVLPFFFFALVLSPRPGETARIHGYATLAALALLAGWAMIQFLFLYRDYGPRIHHPLLSPNNLAVLLNMGLLPALALMFSTEGKKASATLFGLCVLFMAALIVTQSRGAVLSAAIGCIVLLPTMARPFRRNIRKLAGIVAAGAALPVILQVFSVASHGRSIAKTLLQTGGASFLDRGSLWHSTWEMIKDNPLTGTGLGTFYYHYTRYRLPTDRSDGYFVHMDPLQFWVETGLPAFILFYAILIAVLAGTLRSLPKTAPGSRERAYIVGPFCGLLALALHTHIDFHMYLLATLIPAACLLGWWYTATEAVSGRRREALPSSPAARKGVLVAVLLLAIIVAVWVARAGAATFLIDRATVSMVRGDATGMRTATAAMGRFAPASYFWTPQYEARWRIMKLGAEGDGIGENERRRLSGEAEAFLDRAQRYNPAFANLYTDRARLYRTAGIGIFPDRDERIIAALEKALELDPLFLDARIELSGLYRGRGELKKALSVLEEGIMWPRPKGQPDVGFLVTVARLKLALGDREGHDRLIAEAGARAQYYNKILENKRQ